MFENSVESSLANTSLNLVQASSRMTCCQPSAVHLNDQPLSMTDPALHFVHIKLTLSASIICVAPIGSIRSHDRMPSPLDLAAASPALGGELALPLTLFGVPGRLDDDGRSSGFSRLPNGLGDGCRAAAPSPRLADPGLCMAEQLQKMKSFREDLQHLFGDSHPKPVFRKNGGQSFGAPGPG